MESIADFLFEVGMLCKTPRSGYQFLGSGRESVAEHILRTVFIGFCDKCGIEIGIKRLEARPTATLCIDCKTLDEMKERQMAK